MKAGLVYHDDLLRHDPGPNHPEQSYRLSAILDALAEHNLLPSLQRLTFSKATPDQLALVHEPAYVELVRIACREGMTFIGSPDTRLCPESYETARLAVGGILAACDAAMGPGPRRTFCAIRPPGHHAAHDRAAGFCLFNNIAIAAEYLIRRHRLPRIAIVDFDVHHGNGTHDLFYHRDDVLYISLHEHPAFLYPGTGHAADRGAGPGYGFTLNLPLQPGTDDAAYRQLFGDAILPALHRFKPHFLLLSAGFDAAEGERIAHIHLKPDTFHWITRTLVGAAENLCEGRVVSILEGGYVPEALRRSVPPHIQGLLEI